MLGSKNQGIESREHEEIVERGACSSAPDGIDDVIGDGLGSGSQRMVICVFGNMFETMKASNAPHARYGFGVNASVVTLIRWPIGNHIMCRVARAYDRLCGWH